MELDGVGPRAELSRGELAGDREGQSHPGLSEAFLREAATQLAGTRRQRLFADGAQVHALHAAHERRVAARARRGRRRRAAGLAAFRRSEEHTSELQSRGLTSYAV